MVWGLIAFLVGIAYGYMTPGRQDKTQLFWKGTVIGIVLGVALALFGAMSGYDALGFGGGFGLFITIVVLTVLFVIGAWIGDFLEAQPRRAAR
jgi:uncharacterized membrane protein YadS